MAEFLAENNACGQNLLYIVSMGNSIIAEVLRLKDYIPDIFRLESKSDQEKYAEVIMDFSYLKIAEAQDLKIENDPALQDLDEEIRENYLELLTRFYLAFESTHQYAKDLQQFIDELNRGYYIQQTLETVLQDEEGKQLMCEALYIFGVILLILDFHIPGVVRERILISYYRYSGSKSHSDSNIDDVCMLLRSTGYVANVTSAKTTKDSATNYPEAYFGRFKFDENFIDMVMGRLRCDDIYNQLTIYPHPDHRSTALSTQAAMLYVCLYFSPKILHSQVAQMREIVDKFFSDNWVVSIYMGITVNLVDAWDQFKAAKAALSVVETTTIKGHCLLRREKMEKILKQSQEILRDGILTDFFVLQNISKIINLIRQCNVLLRWYFTHASKAIYEISKVAVKQKVDNITALVRQELAYKEADLFRLLLNCSQLELEVKEILRTLMQEKSTRWNDFKKEALDRVSELSEAFSGTRPLSKIESNPQLKLWFADICKEIENLNCDNVNVSGRMLIQLIQALEEVEEFHNLQSNMQVKQYLMETREYLTRMIQIINVKEDILINIQLISDLSYAWHLIDRDFTPIMQDSIKKQPKSVIHLRAAFLKLASALEIPLMRINQAKSEDLVSVSNYYSTELANYMRKVLQIIPETMFNLMARIIQLQTDVLKELPTRLEKEKLKEYAQFEDRYTVAKLTYSISVFTEGILMMKKTLVGVIELDPKQLLEDGIRKELVKHLANAYNLGLIFSPSGKQKQNPTAELETKLEQLAKTMDGYRRSFEYIQDYLNVHGLKILQEEGNRVINYNVERECNAFLRNKIQSWQSKFQSTTIPIPTFPPLQGDCSKSNNFIGRLAYEILQCTDPHNTIYLDLKATWYDKKPPHKEVLDCRFFYKMREAIGPAGLVGLDRLYTYMFANDLKKNMEKLQHNIENDKMWSSTLSQLTVELESKEFPGAYAANPAKFYATYHQRWLKVWPTMVDWILELGHKQILRQHLAFELNRSSKVNAKNLESALETFNRSLLNELENKETQQKFKDTTLLVDIKEYLMYTGTYEPLEEVFVLTKNSHNISLFFSLFVMAHISHFQFSQQIQSLAVKTNKDPLDAGPLMMGLLTILQQFHKDVKMILITYLCQYVAVLVESNLGAKHELCSDVITTLHFLEIFVRKSHLPRSVLTDRLPVIILNQYEYLGLNVKS
uniref:WASH complex subunit strumpellin n=2 Tax=Stomoxys calcitrans TaxID=35570 RepID=A0A1I8NPM8_STOCA